MHVHFTYEIIRIHLSWLTTIARKMFWFISIVAIDDIHLIFRWWLSDHRKDLFRFRIKIFESRTWCWSIIILIFLIRINNDSHFFISCCITEKFFTSWLTVHISQDLIRITTHLDEFMKISRCLQLDC
jgi:hypothetical protein